MLLLSAEFQGFVRDVHGEASIFAIESVRRDSPAGADMLHGLVLRERAIDQGNPTKSNISRDFARLGIDVWSRLHSRYANARTWERRLELLITARNAIAHADDRRRAQLAASGGPIDLAAARRWRSALDQLTRAMDTVIADALLARIGVRPWR